jgi:hypothetical protein
MVDHTAVNVSDQEAAGRDNGPPGLRPQPRDLLAAFVHDADGNTSKPSAHKPPDGGVRRPAFAT